MIHKHWTLFECEVFDSASNSWKKQRRKYLGYHKNFDKKDWRFCEVKGKRSELRFIRLIPLKGIGRGAFTTKQKRSFKRWCYANKRKVKCHICKKKIKKEEFSIDHVKPLDKGGTHDWYNLKPAHIKCNIKKGNK